MTTRDRRRRARTTLEAMPVEDAATTATTWSWELRPADQGTSTRLVTRQRLTFPGRTSTLWHLLEPIDFVMERRMLLGIKWRAERGQPARERRDAACV